ncbi:glutamate racemase [Paenibacillus sp. N1-5-1-14]|uniref:glutamate racemase n=1 Tax=Paenibacillus radicibacter TaxID=2972488 RepID=UPI002159A834|nr:glutamate racemase [Paenibacillus radicibacter]MCR8644341.1 glutamate racemase [Paenibacillus radicibacter]
MRIAFFDSGIGGITVMTEAMKQLPREDYIYYADNLHVPYGTKSKDEVKFYVKTAIDDIMQEEVKAVVIACNTATSIAVADLRNEYQVPIIGLEPAVKPAVEMNRASGKRVLVFATPLTLSQSKYTDLVTRVDDQHIVDSLPLTDLVGYCERLEIEEATQYLQEQLAIYDLANYGTIVLGCTHYPFYKNVIKQLVPDHIQIIDGSNGTVKKLKQELEKSGMLSVHGTCDVKYMCSSHDSATLAKLEKATQIYAEIDRVNLEDN